MPPTKRNRRIVRKRSDFAQLVFLNKNISKAVFRTAASDLWYVQIGKRLPLSSLDKNK